MLGDIRYSSSYLRGLALTTGMVRQAAAKDYSCTTRKDLPEEGLDEGIYGLLQVQWADRPHHRRRGYADEFRSNGCRMSLFSWNASF